MPEKHAIVIGGSIGGLFTAHALMSIGWDVQVFESAQQLDGRGAGIVTHQSLFDTLDTLNIEGANSIGVPIRTRKAFAQDGSEVGSFELRQTVTSWGRLHTVLKNAFPVDQYHTDHTLTHLQTSETSAHCHFSNGKSYSAPVVVAADGIRSTIRQQLEPRSLPVYAGYVAWRGMVAEEKFSTADQENLFPYFTFCLPPGEQLLTYPVAGDDFSTGLHMKRCNAVWYRPADATTTLQKLLTDINGINNGSSIAPNKIRPEVIQEMRRASKALLSPQHASIISKIEQPFIQPIYDLMSESMTHGRVVLIGDAAYTARPHLGMGVTKVAEDAITLATCLANQHNIDQSLQQFKAKRQPINELIVTRSRQLGAYLQARQASKEDRKHAAHYGTVEAVLRETANDEFIRHSY